MKVLHKNFSLHVNLNLTQYPKQQENEKSWVLSQRYLQKWTLAVLFVAFASSSSLSGKTIHQNDELIEGQSEIFFLINNLEFCNIHIQDVVLQKKHFLFWLGNEFLAFSINTYVPFWLFGCVGLVMTKGYLAFNIMQYCKDMFTPRYQTCHATTLTCQN